LAYGDDVAVGAMTVINSMAMLFLMPIFGLNQGSQPIIGFNYGAKAYDRVKETLKYAIFAASGIAIIGFICVEAFAPQIIKLFNSDPKLVEIGSEGIRIYLFMLPVIGFQIISTNYFQSIGKAIISMVLSLLRQVILLIPMYIILPKIFGTLTSVWYAGPIADGTASIITAIFLFKELNRLKVAQDDSVNDMSALVVNEG
jgi:Na+-driven multidrug efflux pump